MMAVYSQWSRFQEYRPWSGHPNRNRRLAEVYIWMWIHGYHMPGHTQSRPSFEPTGGPTNIDRSPVW